MAVFKHSIQLSWLILFVLTWRSWTNKVQQQVYLTKCPSWSVAHIKFFNCVLSVGDSVRASPSSGHADFPLLLFSYVVTASRPIYRSNRGLSFDRVFITEVSSSSFFLFSCNIALLSFWPFQKMIIIRWTPSIHHPMGRLTELNTSLCSSLKISSSPTLHFPVHKTYSSLVCIDSDQACNQPSCESSEKHDNAFFRCSYV